MARWVRPCVWTCSKSFRISTWGERSWSNTNNSQRFLDCFTRKIISINCWKMNVFSKDFFREIYTSKNGRVIKNVKSTHKTTLKKVYRATSSVKKSVSNNWWCQYLKCCTKFLWCFTHQIHWDLIANTFPFLLTFIQFKSITCP